MSLNPANHVRHTACCICNKIKVQWAHMVIIARKPFDYGQTWWTRQVLIEHGSRLLITKQRGGQESLTVMADTNRRNRRGEKASSVSSLLTKEELTGEPRFGEILLPRVVEIFLSWLWFAEHCCMSWHNHMLPLEEVHRKKKALCSRQAPSGWSLTLEVCQCRLSRVTKTGQ